MHLHSYLAQRLKINHGRNSSASGTQRDETAYLIDRQNNQSKGISGNVRIPYITLQKEALAFYSLLALTQKRMEDTDNFL